MCTAVLVALGFTLLVCSAVVSAETHVVGDSKGWGFSVSYDAWSGGKTFAAGDTLGSVLCLLSIFICRNDANHYLLHKKQDFNSSQNHSYFDQRDGAGNNFCMNNIVIELRSKKRI